MVIKAVAGGGGRGIAAVIDPADLRRTYQDIRADAQALLGDSRVYLERFVPSVRHIEFQVLAAAHGNTVHLGERDCSVQRRHQKLIEEAPSPALNEGLRERMGAAAVRGVAALGCRGAGTVEFLLDDDGDFWFMEMNARIQVEHPVTEMVTGIDIVREQIRVAAGEPLSFTQADVKLTGHAIECRVNAEDPKRGFAPTPGRLSQYRAPGGPGGAGRLALRAGRDDPAVLRLDDRRGDHLGAGPDARGDADDPGAEGAARSAARAYTRRVAGRFPQPRRGGPCAAEPDGAASGTTAASGRAVVLPGGR